MSEKPQRKTGRRLQSGMVILLIGIGIGITSAQAREYRFGYSNSHYYPNSGYLYQDNFRLRRELGRIDEQMQRQQRQLDEQSRQQQEQTRLLRLQQSGQQQFSAMQACHYRLNGGLDVCDRLFKPKSDRHRGCVEAAMELNPGCAADATRPIVRSGG